MPLYPPPSGGTGTVTSVTATDPVVITPDPTTTTGDISLNATTADIPDSTDRRYITDRIEDMLTDIGQGIVVGRSSNGNGEVESVTLGDNLQLPVDGSLDVDVDALLSNIIGGSDTELQFNNGGVFGGVSVAVYDGTDLFLDGPIISEDGTNGVTLLSLDPNSVFLQGTLSASTFVSIMPKGSAPANYPSALNFYSTDAVADPSNIEGMQFLSKGSSDTYHTIESFANGSGALRPININGLGSISTAQLVIGTDGGVSIGTGTAAGDNNLLVSGTINGSNLSGTNTGNQTTIVGISGTLAEYNTSLSDANFASGGGTCSGACSGTNTGDQSLAGLVPTSRTLTINGDAKDLSADRSWTVTAAVDEAADYDWTGDHTFGSELTIAQTPNGDFTIADGFSMIVPSLYNLPTTTALTINGTGILMVA